MNSSSKGFSASLLDQVLARRQQQQQQEVECSKPTEEEAIWSFLDSGIFPELKDCTLPLPASLPPHVPPPPLPLSSMSMSMSMPMPSSDTLVQQQQQQQRFEPLLDPALSYISSILAQEEDEDYSLGHPCMSMAEFLAFQEKTLEMAALLHEDSPSLHFAAQKIVESPRPGLKRSSDDIMTVKPPKRKAKKETSGRKRSRAEKEGNGRELVDLMDMLQQVAQSVGTNNVKAAAETLKKVKGHASPYGSGAERLAYYFSEALDARLSGTGWPLYFGLLHRRPSPTDVLRATSVYMAKCPFIKFSNYFINQTILNVSKGASTVYIIDLQLSGGFNYPSLFKNLAKRPGGPPQIKLTAVGFPHYSIVGANQAILEGLQKTGRQLSSYAASCGVSFEFAEWVGSRELLQMQDFVPERRTGNEALVIISAHLLRYVMDDSLDSPDARRRLLEMGRSLNPDVYIQGIVTASYNMPYFPRRFREALFYFESLYDVLDTFIERENPDRVIFESEILGKAILNIVACEGAQVADRIDKYKHWQQVTEEAGFVQLPLNEEIKTNAAEMMRTWHKEYTVAEDRQYMLFGWKGRMLHAMSTWSVAATLEAHRV